MLIFMRYCPEQSACTAGFECESEWVYELYVKIVLNCEFLQWSHNVD